nr:MAG TPA: hypothetical protein [Caudoviricetes sp.]
MRKRNYKTIRGLMRQKYYGFLSVSDVISGSYYHKHGWYQPFTLTDEALREFTDGICGALNMKDKGDVFDNIRFGIVKECGILKRIGVEYLRSGKLSYTYMAGQDYTSEARFVRKLLRCK